MLQCVRCQAASSTDWIRSWIYDAAADADNNDDDDDDDDGSTE